MAVKTLDFAVVGAQKAASTWVTQNLRGHPQIWIPREEIPCFEDGFLEVDPVAVAPSPEDSVPILGIKNNNLLFKPESPKLLNQHSSHLLIVVSLRDPIDRLISSYYWHMRIGALPILPPEIGLTKALEDRVDSLIEPGYDGRQFERFANVFPYEQIHVILFEDIRDAPRRTLEALYRFLGVDPDVDSKSLEDGEEFNLFAWATPMEQP